MAAFTPVQSGGVAGGFGASLTYTFTGPVTVGDLVVVLTSLYQANPAALAVTDNYANTYLNARDALESIGTGVNDQLDIWYSVVGAAGPSFAVTMTPSTSNKMSIGAAEFSLSSPIVSVGANAAGSGTGSTAAPGSLPIAGDDLVVAVAAYGSTAGNPSAPGAGYTSIFENADATVLIGFASEFQTSVTSGPATPTFGFGGSTGWGSIAAAFNLVGDQIGPVGRGMRVASPRKPRNGRAFTPALAPAGNPGATIAGLQVTSRRRPRHGSATVGQILFQQLLTAPGTMARSTRKPRSGRVLIQSFDPPGKPGSTITGIQVSSRRKPRRGSASVGQLASTVSVAPSAASGQSLVVRSPRKPRGGSVQVGRFLSPPPPVFHTPLTSVRTYRTKRDIYYRQRTGQSVRFRLPPFMGAGQVQYHIYANTGIGDPINYVTPIATTALLTYTTVPLAYPGTWSFGVRAFDLNGEEQNLEAAVTFILSAAGVDITNMPVAPIGLGAFATVGGGIRVQWTYPGVSTQAKTPTGFHVYTGSGTPSYVTAVATVLWGQSLGGSFVSNLGPYANGTVLAIGVRAYNSTAEESNTTFVTVTADAVGPSAVVSLTAQAVV